MLVNPPDEGVNVALAPHRIASADGASGAGPVRLEDRGSVGSGDDVGEALLGCVGRHRLIGEELGEEVFDLLCRIR